MSIMDKEERLGRALTEAEKLAEERLLDIMAPYPKKKSAMPNPFEMFFNNGQNSNNTSANNNTYDADMQAIKDKREILKQKLRRQELEDDMIEVAIRAVEEVFDWKAYLKENFEEK